MAKSLHLQHVHERLGACLGEADGHRVPFTYGDPVGEYRALREGAGVVDRSHRGKLAATGRDRVSFFQGLLSSDVKALQPGHGCLGSLLDVHGKIQALLVVHCLADRLILETDHEAVAPTLAHIDRYLISEAVELDDMSETFGILTVAGPEARATVERALGQPLPALSPWHHAEAPWAGAAVRVVRAEAGGEDGYDLWPPAAEAERLWECLREAGARPVGRTVWNVVRVEAGVVWAGVDVDATTLLLEAPLEAVYSLQKGCYLGQEVVARITYRGRVNRRIVGFRFPDDRAPVAGAPVVVDGREVGRITSAVVSPVLGCAVALGFLRREHWEPGTAVEVHDGDAVLPAEVSPLPFYRRPASLA